MERIKRLVLHLVSLPGISTRWAFAVIHGKESDDMVTPGDLIAVWTVQEAEPSKRPERSTAVPTPRLISPAPAKTADRILQALQNLALWFGLLFSAVMLGTFIVIGLVLSYALLMSLTGH